MTAVGFKNLGDLIVRDRDLAKTAIIDLGGETPPREFTFAQLDAMANGVARALVKRGLQRGDRVALLSLNRAEYLAAYYGIMRAGLVAVPVNFKFPRDTIHFILRDAGARLVFCDAARAADCPPDIPSVTLGAAFDAFLDPGPFEAVVPQPREPAMILYTSGSTGKPKGVVLSHQSHIWVVETRLAPGLERQRYLIAAPLYHMNALALAKLACAAHATIVLLPQFSARAYIEAIGRYRASFLTAVPPMIAMMLREAELLARTDLSSVAFVRMGSAPVSASLMAALRAALPQAAVTNAYGTTEAGPGGVRPASARSAAAGALGRLSASAGRAAPRRRRQPQRGARCTGNEMPGGDERLSQPSGRRSRRSRRTASTSPATCSAATPTVFIISSAAPTTCSSPAARIFIRPTSSACWSATPSVAQAAVVPIDDDIKGQKPVAFVIRKAGHALERRRGEAIRARPRAGLCASALRLVRRRTAARLDQQARPRGFEGDGA